MVNMNMDEIEIKDFCDKLLADMKLEWDPLLKDSNINKHKEKPKALELHSAAIEFNQEMSVRIAKTAMSKEGKVNNNTATKKSARQLTKREKKELYPVSAAKLFYNIHTLVNETRNSLIEAKNVYIKERTYLLDCCKDLEILGPNFRAYPIGSRALGLADHYSDLDVFLDLGNMYYGYDFQDAQSQEKIVHNVKRAMRKNRRVWDMVIAVPFARTPIIKVCHRPSGLNLDISFRHGLSFENTRLIRYMLDLMPIARPLILILKKWSYGAILDQYIRSYTLSIMVIFYLQINKLLPSVASLKPPIDCYPPIIVSGWECNIVNICFVSKSPPSFLDLLHGFFYYYSQVFNYETQVVCPLLGHAIFKHQFENNGANLPPEMSSYKFKVTQYTDNDRNIGRVSKYVADHPLKEIFRYDSPMCVQDPFDLMHNLAKAVSPNIMQRFKNFCAIEAQNIQNMIENLSPSDYNDGFWKI